MLTLYSSEQKQRPFLQKMMPQSLAVVNEGMIKSHVKNRAINLDELFILPNYFKIIISPC